MKVNLPKTPWRQRVRVRAAWIWSCTLAFPLAFLLLLLPPAARRAGAQFATGPGTNKGTAIRAFGTGGATAGGGGAAPAVDILLDFEAGVNGLWTSNQLFNSSHSNANWGRWQVKPDPQVFNIFTNDQNIPLIAPVTCGGVTYTDAGSTRSGFAAMVGSTEHDGQFKFNSTNYQGQFGVSFFFQMLPNTVLSDFIDLVHLDGFGEYAVAAITSENPPTFKLHSNTNFGTISANITIQSNYWYFANISWDTNTGPTGICTLQLYNGTNGAFIAYRQLGHNSKQMCAEVWFAKTDVHTYTMTNRVRIDNIMFRLNQSANRGSNYVWGG